MTDLLLELDALIDALVREFVGILIFVGAVYLACQAYDTIKRKWRRPE